MSDLMTGVRQLSITFVLLINGLYAVDSQATGNDSLVSVSATVLMEEASLEVKKTSDTVLTKIEPVGMKTENTIFDRLKGKSARFFDEVVGKVKPRSAKDLSKKEKKRYHRILLVVSSLCSSGVRLSSPM